MYFEVPLPRNEWSIYVQTSRRNGLTILEVLISIGVATIGLLGVLALLPLASVLAQRGLNEDAQSALGPAAVDQFKIIGGANPLNWFHDDDNDGTWELVWRDTDGNGRIDVGTLPSNSDVRLNYCIDPRLIANNTFTSAPKFPLSSPDPAIQMDRITFGNEGPPVTTMSKEFADLICQTSDDLLFDTQTDTTLPPLAGFDFDSATPANAIRRQSMGNVSWMALVFGLDSLDVISLSIVVFHQRDLDVTTTPSIERIAQIDNADFYGGGVTGGDVRIHTTTVPIVKTDRNRAAEVDVREGDWLLLARSGIYAWYRVIAVDSDEGPDVMGDPDDDRDVTLFGPDWPLASGSPAPPTYAIFIPGVVAVYEKTIRLESTSVWNSN
jgi:hypothetical protein